MLAALVIVPLFLSQAAQPWEEPPGRAPECLAVKVASSAAQDDAQGRREPAFSTTRILELQLSTMLRRNLAGTHLLELKLYTPRGNLYQVLSVPFGDVSGGPPGPKPRRRYLAGYPAPLDEKRPEPAEVEGRQRLMLSSSLPVAGTSIVTSSLYGSWTVVPYLDGRPEPCGTASRFTIGQ